MDARTHIENRLPGRHVTDGPSRAGSTDAALHLPAIAHVAEILKKAPDAADLKPCGRYLASDLRQVADIPLLMKTLLDKGHLDGDCITVPGRPIAEDLKSVKCNPRPDVARRAPDGAIAEVAAMSKLKFAGPARCFDRQEKAAVGGPIDLLQRGNILEIDAEAGILNVKLTVAAITERRTKWKSGKTNHRSGALWKYAQQIGPAVDGAVTHPGGAHEKQCYADI